MKTKELIRQLQAADPSGETECCVGNVDIFFVERLPAYYDGTLQVLGRDHRRRGDYNIISGEYRRSGEKIMIRTLDIETAIFDNPDLPVLDEDGRHRAKIQEWRRESEEARIKSGPSALAAPIDPALEFIR